jgi:hypothetical protein
MLQEIRCPHCKEFICLSSGEVKRDKCDRCKKPIHVVVTSKGIIDLSDISVFPIPIMPSRLEEAKALFSSEHPYRNNTQNKPQP